MIRDRIVLIGVTSANSGDRWGTLYGQGFQAKLPGVLLHAHMISQLLSAAMDKRPLLWVWSPPLEALWISVWSGMGAVLGVLAMRRLWWWAGIGSGVVVAFVVAYVGFLQMLWLPLVPVLLVFVVAAQIAQLWRQKRVD